MFRYLRNRLIVINLIITTIVLIAAFSSIYAIAQNATDARPSIPKNNLDFSPDMSEIINEQMRVEREAALSSLLWSLIIVGIIVEAAVAVISYFLAEAAIRPVKMSYETQKTFIANASHEIKTPLAAISANLEAANITNNRWIKNITQEVHSLTKLNNDLLALVQADYKTPPNQDKTLVSPSVLVKKVIAIFEPQLARQKTHFIFHDLSINEKHLLNQSDFQQILTILFDNTLKYSDQEIALVLSAKQLYIENDGAKINNRDLSHIFDRFYQTDKSAEGAGLGLAIASSLAERNHWKLTATSDKVTRFTLDF